MSYDFMFRAKDKVSWDKFAKLKNLTTEVSYGEETQNLPTNQVYIDEIGPIVSEPAVFNANGEITTPAVMDNGWHVNVRIVGNKLVVNTDLDGNETSSGWDFDGLTAISNTTIKWVDPATVDNPRRIFAGGMNYYITE